MNKTVNEDKQLWIREETIDGWFTLAPKCNNLLVLTSNLSKDLTITGIILQYIETMHSFGLLLKGSFTFYVDRGEGGRGFPNVYAST